VSIRATERGLSPISYSLYAPLLIVLVTRR
jgi:hypothetical protein